MLINYYRKAGFTNYKSSTGAPGVLWMMKDCSFPSPRGGIYEAVEQRAESLAHGDKALLRAQVKSFLPKLFSAF